VLEHPPYSPDLAPSDFFLFLKMKEILKGRHFHDINDIRSNMTVALKAIPQKPVPKGSILKANTVIFSNEVCSTSTAMCSRTLLSDRVLLLSYNAQTALIPDSSVVLTHW
jgi:hypothetical protein